MIKKTGFIILLLSLMLAGQGFCGELEDAITKGNEFVQKKDYEKAVQEYERAVKINPKSSKAYLLLGLTYANTGKLDLAVKNSSYAAVLDPSYAAYHNLGLIYANKGDYDKAVDAYEKALKINPTSYRAWYEFGLLQAGNGYFKEAVDCYKKSVELNAAFPESRLGLGSAQYWNGNKAAALAEVEALRGLKEKDKADTLESWIEDKEAKKAQQNQKPAAAPAAEEPKAPKAKA